jgi:hypothetical protein
VAENDSRVLYPDNEVDGFRMGALFDLRVRMAFEMLQHGDLSAIRWQVTGTPEEAGQELARACFAAMSELVRIAEAEGLVKPLPDGGEISATLRKHAPRLVRWQAEQQIAAQRLQHEFAGRIATPPGTPAAAILPGNGQGH